VGVSDQLCKHESPPGVGEMTREVGELLPDEVVDELLASARREEEIVGPGALLRS
jgi:hypothetical protein